MTDRKKRLILLRNSRNNITGEEENYIHKEEGEKIAGEEKKNITESKMSISY